jgi:hypothetical protein
MSTKSLIDEYESLGRTVLYYDEDTHIMSDLEDQPILKDTRPLRSTTARLFGSINNKESVSLREKNGMIERMRIFSWPMKVLMWLILTGGFVALIYFAGMRGKSNFVFHK